MADRSFRDRFLSPRVARALTSPSGILAAGAGAAVGVVVAPASVPLAIAAGVVGGALGMGARLAAAIPRKEAATRIDPFAVPEPWRHSVIDALQAQVRFDQAVKSFEAGPLKDTVVRIGVQIDNAVDQCWEVAQQGHAIAEARRRMNDRSARTELARMEQALGEDGAPNEVQAHTIRALRSQVETAERMDALLSATNDRLDLLNARLDESVTRAIELSVSNRSSDADALGDDVGRIVDDLETLRAAIEDLDHRPPHSATLPPPTSSPGT